MECKNKGLKISEIAQNIGCSAQTIYKKYQLFSLNYKLSDKITKELLISYKDEGLTQKQICQKLNCGEGALCKYLKKYNIAFKKDFGFITKEWLLEQQNNGFSKKEVAIVANCSLSFIHKKIKDLGLTWKTNRIKYKINENYFDNWSHQMAYVVGFIMADGCVNKLTNREDFRLRIAIQARDIEILEFIRDAISPTRPISTIYLYNKKYNKIYKQVVLLITLNKKLVFRLNQLGITERKSGKEKIPDNIPKEFIWSFILGYFDGDGCITKRKEYGYCWSICSSCYNIIKDFYNLIPYGCIEVARAGEHGRKVDLWSIRVYAKDNIKQIRSLIYKDRFFSLSRKYNKMMQV